MAFLTIMNHCLNIFKLYSTGLLVLLSACSSHIPAEISTTIADSPDISQVRNSPGTYLSKKVRWGGVILNTENKENSSWITIIAFPLSKNGEPQISDNSPGRFIAIVDGFLEPLLYYTEREITVTGELLKTEIQNIGEFPYEYPVVKVDSHYLWEDTSEYDESDYPPYWWYDPWYHPLYPYHPHRYNRY